MTKARTRRAPARPATSKRSQATRAFESPGPKTPRVSGPPIPILGREADVLRLEALLSRASGVVTIVGSPGVGKSRLAEAILATGGIPGSVRLQLRPGMDARSLSRLASREMQPDPRSLFSTGALVILDDADTVERDTLGLIVAWSNAGARILVTAREPLHVPGERIFSLQPLTEAGALALFDMLLAESRADTTSSSARSALSKIATVVSGLPLAIELLAPLIAVTGADHVLTRLREVPDAVLNARLAGETVLRIALDSAWMNLDSRDRSALAKLAVFLDAFTMDGAEAVLGGEAHESVQTLCAKSLLAPAGRGGPRFHLLKPIATFAREKLLGDAKAEAERRHALYFSTLSRAVTEEWSDLVAAIERSISLNEEGSTRVAIRLLHVLEPIVAAAGSTVVHLGLAERIAAACERHAVPSVDYARALLMRADAERRAGRLAEAARDFAAVAKIADTATRPELLGRAERGLGAVLHSKGDTAAAEQHFSRALALLLDLGDDDHVGILQSDLGANCLAQGDPRRARTYLEPAIERLGRSGNVLHLAGAHANLGVACLETEDLETARACFETTLNLLGGTESMVAGFALANLGLVAHFQGDLTAAIEFYHRASRVAEEAGSPHFVGTFTGYLAVAALEQGRFDEGHRLVLAATSALALAGDARYESLFLAVKACFEWLLVRPGTARSDLVRAASGSRENAIAVIFETLEDAGLSLDEAERRDAGAPIGRDDATTAEHRLLERVAACVRREARRRGTERLRLRVAPDAMWFILGRDPCVSLRHHGTMRLILGALVAAHVERQTISRDELISICWPGERLSSSSGRNRLKVAISQIRRLGLQSVIQTTETGYGIVESCELAVESYED